MGSEVVITMDSRVRVQAADLPLEARESLRFACTYENPSRGQLERLSRVGGARAKALFYALKSTPTHLMTWHEAEGELSVPRGALFKLRAVLRASGLRWRIDDRRTMGNGPAWGRVLTHRPDPAAPDGGTLRWYQQEAVEAALERENCLVRAPTGSGKTTSAIALIARLQIPTLVILWTGGLLGQWMDRLQAELGLSRDEIGQLGGGRKQVAPVTLAMQQTLARGDLARKHAGVFGLMICDEVQRYAASTFHNVIDHFTARYRLGFSADETRKDKKECLIYDQFGAVAHEVTQDELIDEGAVLDVECRIVPTNFRADWYVETRKSGGMPDHHRLLDEMAADSARNEIVMGLVCTEIRLGQRVAVLTARVDHARAVDQMITAAGYRSDLMLGGADWKERFAQAKVALLEGRIHAVAGTVQAIGTGIDMPALARGVLTTPVGNNRQLFAQIRGRFCRLGKADAILYVLWDRHVNGQAPIKNLVRWNRRVLVRDDSEGSWIDGRQYLREMTDGEK